MNNETGNKYRKKWATHDAYKETQRKVCQDCGKELLSTEFYLRRSVIDGLDCRCKTCSAKFALKCRRENPGWFLIYAARQRARKKGWGFNLTIEDAFIPEKCPVLNIVLSVGKKKLHHGSPTLDRIDSNKGYIKGNVRVISHRANTIKSNATIEELELVLKDSRNPSRAQGEVPVSNRKDCGMRRRKTKGRMSSRFKGVCWNKKGECWVAYVYIEGKYKHLGRFATETEAARAYDLAALALRGPAAVFNLGEVK